MVLYLNKYVTLTTNKQHIWKQGMQFIVKLIFRNLNMSVKCAGVLQINFQDISLSLDFIPQIIGSGDREALWVA